jgi:BirA family transcriptional regulator, biotin operon repressor / biotin---[acetyl-CoA-carboxylase] ligase
VDLEGARSVLAGSRFARLRAVAETGSTNADLMDAARRGEPEQALVAEHQTAGRGRLDREWEAPRGASLLMSVLVHPPFPVGGPHAIPTALGVALVDAIAALGGISVGLKWPNDLVVATNGAEERKVGGILAESLGADGLDAVVAGVGVNLDWPTVPAHLDGIATSLNLEGATIDRCALAANGLARFAALLSDGHLHRRYRAACVTIGRRVRIERPDDELIGTATDVSVGGGLVVDDDAGTRHVVTVGDVIHLRPAP